MSDFSVFDGFEMETAADSAGSAATADVELVEQAMASEEARLRGANATTEEERLTAQLDEDAAELACIKAMGAASRFGWELGQILDPEF